MSRGQPAVRSPNEYGPGQLAGSSPAGEGRALWLLAVPLVMAVAAYARALDGEFQLDDFHAIVDNSGVKDLAAATGGFARALFAAGRPVTNLTFAVNYAVGHLEPWNFHATNLAIHVAAAVLVFFLGRTALRIAGAASASLIALVVAGVFALHPIQTQAVSYVVQRAETLASALYVAALLLLLTAERRGLTVGGILAYLAGIAAFVLGLGAKMILVTTPVAYLLLTFVVPDAAGRKSLASWPRRVAMIAPWFALDAWFAHTAVCSMEGLVHAGFDIPALPAGSYFLSQLRALTTYLRLLFWPSGQNVDWMLRSSDALESAVVLAGLALFALALLAAALYWRARDGNGPDAACARVAAFGIAWFFVVLAPTSSFVPLADLLVEHRVYLASWGVFLAVFATAERLLARAPALRWLAAASVGMLWVALAIATHQRNAVWESRVALWTDSVSKNAHNWRAHTYLGWAHNYRGEYDLAMKAYRQAVAEVGDELPYEKAALLGNLGAALANSGRVDEAVAALEHAIDLDSGNVLALYSLAKALAARGEAGAAETYAARAVALAPEHGPSLSLFGRILAERGAAHRALPLLLRAAATDPDELQTQLNTIMAYARMGRTEDACAIAARAATRPFPSEQRQLIDVMAASVGCR